MIAHCTNENIHNLHQLHFVRTNYLNVLYHSSIKIPCIITQNISQFSNLSLRFGILYIKVNGEIVEYSAYDAENNSRSIAEVSEAAYNDFKTTADEVYKYATTTEAGVTVYSPYTEEQRKVLASFFQ